MKKRFFKKIIKRSLTALVMLSLLYAPISPISNIRQVEAAPIAQYSGGLLVYADDTVGTPKYKVFDDTGGFGAEQSATSVGAAAITWIRVAASPTKDEWIIATKDAAATNNVIKVQVCTGADNAVTCGATTTINAAQGVATFRNFDVAYEQTSGDALLVYGTSTADELRKIEWTGGAWVTDAAITTTRTAGTVEWVELTSRNDSDQIGIAYSDTGDDVSAYRWSGTAVGDEATAVIWATASTANVRKFDVSFEGTSGDMLVAVPVTALGSTQMGQLTAAGAWTIPGTADIAPDNITDFIDLQEPNPSDNDIGMVAHGVTAAGANTMEGYEWSGTAVVDGTIAVDTSATNWAANYQIGAAGYVSSTYYTVGVFSDVTGEDDINWWTMGSTGTWTAQADNLRTRGVIRFVDLFDYPNADKTLLFSSDANSDLWADTWDGTTPSSSVWVDRTSGGALELALASATTDVYDFAFRISPLLCTSQVTTGNWNTAGTWDCGHVPLATESVTIRAGDTITMDINSTALNTLTVNGTLTTSGTNYSLSATTISIGTAGTLTANASAISLTGTTGTLFTITGSGVFTAGTSTVTMSGNGAATINNSDITFFNLASSGTGTKTLGAFATVVGGTLGVSAGTMLTVGAAFTVTGTTTVNGGILTLDNNTGAKILTGAVAVSSGTLNGASTLIEIRNGITQSSTGTVSITGTATFNTNAQTLAGTQSITTITNNVTSGNGLTFSDSGTTVTTLTQGTNAVLTFSGTMPTITTLNASTNTPNTVEYNANGTQTIKVPSVSYWHLNLAGTGTSTKTAGGALTVNGDFTIGGNATFAGGTSLTHTFLGNWIVNTTAGTSPYSFTTGGTINFNTPGTPAATSISGSPTTAPAFSAINVNNTSGFSISTNISAAGTVTVAASVTVTPGASNTLSGAGTLTGSGNVKVTGISGTNDFLLQYSISSLTLTNLTVDYSGVNQGFSNATYGNVLISANSIQTGVGTGTIGGSFTVGASGVFTPSSGTTTFNNGASIVNSGTLTFSSITIASGATVTTSSSFTINGTLTNSSTGTFNPSGGTITMATTGWSIVNSGTSLTFNNLTISETPSVQSSSSYSINGILTVNSTKTLAPTGGTITMTGGSIANSGGAATNLVFNNLTVSGSVTANSQSFNIAGVTSITGTLTVSSGAGTITASGNVTGTGTMSLATGTFTQSVGAAASFGPTSTNDWTFNNLTFSASAGAPTITTSSTSTGRVIVGATLTVGASITLDAANRTWRLLATGTPFTLTGSLTANTSTFSYEGATSGVTVTAATYYNLGVGTNANGTATTFTLGGNTTASNLLTVGDAGSSATDILDASSFTLTLSGTGTPFVVTATWGSFTESTSTVNYTGTAAGVTVTADTYNNLGVGTTGDANTVTYTLNSSITVSGVLTIGASSGAGVHSFNPTSATVTLSGTGTPVVINSQGSLTPSTSTISYTGTSSGVNVAGATYYDLKVGITGDANTVSYTLNGNTTVNDILTIGASSGAGTHSLDGSSFTLTLSGTTGTPMTLGTQGTFIPSTSTVSYIGNNGGGNTTLANVTYNNLTCNNASETWNAAASPLTLNGSLTVTAGTLDLAANNLSVGSSGVANSGGISNSGTITQSASATTTILSSTGGAASIGGSGTTTFYNLTFAPTVASAPTFTLGTGASQTITVSNILTIGNATNNVTVTASVNNPTIDVNGTFTINTNGSFTSTSGNLSIAGNMTNNGTFTHNSGTVTIDGAGTSVLAGSGSPAITFNNFTAITASKTLNFTASQTFRVNGLLNLDNQAINSTTSTQWLINHQGTESVTNSTITNSGCDGTSTIITLNATDTNGGNNGTCWDFASVIYPNPVRFSGSSVIKGNTRIRN